ncbi:unnamed protein product [Durusdinium trenchii]|uniref:Uncharacterized protein n=1 Tax=Durusdinium trenchii TaxID=1381693 RepID=A0ABP0N9F9_9DINO
MKSQKEMVARVYALRFFEEWGEVDSRSSSGFGGAKEAQPKPLVAERGRLAATYRIGSNLHVLRAACLSGLSFGRVLPGSWSSQTLNLIDRARAMRSFFALTVAMRSQNIA